MLFSVMYRISLDISYVFILFPNFEYAGYLYELNFLRLIETWIIYVIILNFTPMKMKRPSDFYICYMLFFVLTPLIIFFCWSGASRYNFYLIFSIVPIIYFARILPNVKINSVYFSRSFPVGLCLSVIFVAGIWMVISGGISKFNLDMDLVYHYRSDVDKIINVGFISYIISWASNVAAPFLLAICLWYKKHIFALLMIFVHIFFYGVTSAKGIIFYPFLILFVRYAFSNNSKLYIIPLGLFLISIGSSLLYFWLDDLFVFSLLVRRTLFVPAYLSFIYLEFFQANQFIFWSQNFMSFLIDYPYDAIAAEIISRYIGEPSGHANNSFIVNGFMHAGFLGIIFYGLIFGLILSLYDALAYRMMPIWVAISVLIIPMHSLITSADLPTSIITHGIALGILILFLMRRNLIDTSNK
jgi:hypothetical protein